MFLLDEGQNIVKSYRYDAFGEVRKEGSGEENRITYTRQVYDKKAEQYYLRARYYNPMIGRFMQEDTYRGDVLNLYAYCQNNPVKYYDPSGYMSLCPDPGTPNRKSGGRFADVDATRGPDEVGHHVAQNRYNQDIGISRSDGPALLMTKEDHALTRTFRGRGSAIMINAAGLSARERMVLDIIDIRNQFGTKYNEGMIEMIKHAKTLPQYSR